MYCLAGKGRRFTDKNITAPKFLLQLDDEETILEKSLHEFAFPREARLVLVINKEHESFVGQIEDILQKQENEFKIIITEDTKGQAETAFIGCSAIDNEYPVFFFNGDTILRKRNILIMSDELTKNMVGAIDVFFEDRNHFSFVELTEHNLVVKIAEKEAISRYATTGLYGFSSKTLYSEYYKKTNITTEIYISDIYKLMLLNNEPIKAYVSPNENDTIILGTPEEYFANKHKI